jgi:hypothetical protein
VQPFEHVRDLIFVAVVGAVFSPQFREAEAAKDWNRAKRSDRRQSQRAVDSIFRHSSSSDPPEAHTSRASAS